MDESSNVYRRLQLEVDSGVVIPERKMHCMVNVVVESLLPSLQMREHSVEILEFVSVFLFCFKFVFNVLKLRADTLGTNPSSVVDKCKCRDVIFWNNVHTYFFTLHDSATV